MNRIAAILFTAFRFFGSPSAFVLLIPILAHSVDGQASEGLRWRGLIIAGESSEYGFDNSAQAMQKMLLAGGVLPEDTAILSSWRNDDPRQLPSYGNVWDFFARSQPAKGDGCFFFITSHGISGGIYVKSGQTQYQLSAQLLNNLLENHCGGLPTVVVASACFSGAFAAPPMQSPNRVIFTAARIDRQSFGCHVKNDFPFFDFCFLYSIPDAQTWDQIADRLQRCVKWREERIVTRPSEPQIFIGEAMRVMAPPKIPKSAFMEIWHMVPENLSKANAVPMSIVGAKYLNAYRGAAKPKAFAVGLSGAMAWAQRDDQAAAEQAAQEGCAKHEKAKCWFFAKGNEIVWLESARALIDAREELLFGK